MTIPGFVLEFAATLVAHVVPIVVLVWLARELESTAGDWLGGSATPPTPGFPEENDPPRWHLEHIEEGGRSGRSPSLRPGLASTSGARTGTRSGAHSTTSV